MNNQINVPFAVQSSKTRSSKATNEQLINVYPEKLNANADSPLALFGRPGLKLFQSFEGRSIKAMNVMADVLYVLTDRGLFSINKDGTIKKEGSVTVNGPVEITNNGYQLVFVDGHGGWYFEKGHGIKPITADGFYPSNSVDVLDGYFIFNRKGTGQFFISDLLSVQFIPTDYATAEGNPDPVIAVIADHRQLYLFGTRTVEAWYNSGNVDFPFARHQNAFIEKGCGAPRSISKMDNILYFLGHDGIVYNMAGFTPKRVSTHAVEYSISKGDYSDAIGYNYLQEGHSFYVLTFPTIGITWVYDAATGTWHERETYCKPYWQATSHVYWNHTNYVGDAFGPNVFELDMDTYTDNGVHILRSATSPPITNNRDYLRLSTFEVNMDTGIGNPPPTTIETPDPLITMQWTDDGLKWSNQRQKSLGRVGATSTRIRWTRIGTFRERSFRVWTTAPLPFSLMGAYVS